MVNAVLLFGFQERDCWLLTRGADVSAGGVAHDGVLVAGKICDLPLRFVSVVPPPLELEAEKKRHWGTV